MTGLMRGKPMLVDSHCHLDFPEFAGRLDQVFDLMTKNGVGYALCASVTLERLPAMLASDAGYLLYTIADRVVDSLFPVLDRMLDDVDAVEDRVILHPDRELLERIFAMKRNGVTLRKLVSPHLEIFTRFTSPAYGIVSDEHLIYYRDVHDHLIRLFEIVDSYRELMTGALEVHLSTVNS